MGFVTKVVKFFDIVSSRTALRELVTMDVLYRRRER